MRNRRFISILLTLCMALSLLPTSALAAAEQFTDVKAGAWYYEDVDFVTDKGYFKGMSDTIFAPDETMTRAMFVTVLARYAGAKVDDSTSTFTDVPTGTWYTGAVTWAAKKGIVEGRGNGIFDPNGAVTREEMCTIIARYLKACDLDAKLAKKPATITDMETVSAYAVEAVKDCVAYGVIIGYPDGTFGPKITASRAHVAAILHRLQVIVDEAEEKDPPAAGPKTYEAVYVGVKDFVTLNTKTTAEDDFIHLFYVDGNVKEYDIEGGDPYVIENQLRGGYIYNITVKNNKVIDVEEAEVETGVAGDFDLTGKKLYEIESPLQASGAVVNKVDSIAADATVKVTKKNAYQAFVAEEYTVPLAVQAVPGEVTLKNFLATALTPVGTALYVYGGAWDWQDDTSSNQSMTIGIPQEWIDTFQSQDTTYHYKKKDASGSYADSFYTSNRGWNQYYWAGVDCSAYVGWATWNILNTENGVKGEDEGYVMSSTNMASNYADYGWGTYDKGEYVLNADGSIYADGDGDSHRIFDVADFKVGDIFSDNGHVWIVLGVCEDGSMVFMHSTPSTSKDGLGEGGGIQISALDLEGRENSFAAQLADHYMSTYYPEWSERYAAVTKGESYINVYDTGVPGTDGFKARKAGRFTWNLESGIMADPDDFASKTPTEILGILYNDSFQPVAEEEPEIPEIPVTPIVPALADYTALAVNAAVTVADKYLHVASDAMPGAACVEYDAENHTIAASVAGSLNEAHLKDAAKMALEMATILVGKSDTAVMDSAVVEAVEDILYKLTLTEDAELEVSKAEVKAIAKEIVEGSKTLAKTMRAALANYNGAYPFNSITVQCAGQDLFTVNVDTGLDVKALVASGLAANDVEAVKVAMNATVAALLDTFDLDLFAGSNSYRATIKSFAKVLAKELHETLAANGGPTNEVVLEGTLTLVMDVKAEIAEQCTDTFTVACEATLASDLVTYENKGGKDYLTVTVTEDMQNAYNAVADYVFNKIKPYLIGEKNVQELATLLQGAAPVQTYALSQEEQAAALLANIDINKYMTPEVMQALLSNDNEALYDVMDEVIAEAVTAEDIADMGIDVADLANTYATASEEVKAELDKVIVKPAVQKVQETLAEQGIEASETLATYATYTVLDKVMNDEIQKVDPEAKVEHFAAKAETAKQEVIVSGELDTLINEQVRPEADKVIEEKLEEANKQIEEKLGFAITKEMLKTLADLTRFETMKEKQLGGILPLLKTTRLDGKGDRVVDLVSDVLDALVLYVPAGASVTVDGMTVESETIEALRAANTTKEVRLAVCDMVKALGALSISSFEDGADITVTAAGYTYTMNLTIEVK